VRPLQNLGLDRGIEKCEGVIHGAKYNINEIILSSDKWLRAVVDPHINRSIAGGCLRFGDAENDVRYEAERQVA
jgi:hypothetical protein